MKISGVIASDVEHMGMVQSLCDATPPNATKVNLHLYCTLVESGLEARLDPHFLSG